MKSSIQSLHHIILGILRYREAEKQPAKFLRELFAFGYKEAISCIFPVFVFGMLALTRLIEVPGISRYDFLLIACLAMQVFMYFVGLESKRELVVICFFHAMGICMEIFKVAHGSWSYPDHGWSKLAGVPLYSGFMYASVASYICQAWRNMDLYLEKWPTLPSNVCFAVAIYGNFFSNAYIRDIRPILLVLLFWVFRNTYVYFNTNDRWRRMPMMLSFLLIAFFIWLAENIGTFLGAWRYPHQHAGWSAVKIQILSSWFLLVIVSVIIVALLKLVFEPQQTKGPRSHQK